MKTITLVIVGVAAIFLLKRQSMRREVTAALGTDAAVKSAEAKPAVSSVGADAPILLAPPDYAEVTAIRVSTSDDGVIW